MPRGLWEDEFYMTQSILLVIIVIDHLSKWRRDIIGRGEYL